MAERPLTEGNEMDTVLRGTVLRLNDWYATSRLTRRIVVPWPLFVVIVGTWVTAFVVVIMESGLKHFVTLFFGFGGAALAVWALVTGLIGHRRREEDGKTGMDMDQVPFGRRIRTWQAWYLYTNILLVVAWIVDAIVDIPVL